MKRTSTKRASPEIDAATPMTDQSAVATSMPAIVDAIAEVGRQRSELLGKLREALQSGNNLLALDLARELCGLNNGKQGNRVN